MSRRHKELATGRWQSLSIVEQLANVGSEIERTIRWREKGNEDYAKKAFERALELLELTMEDPKNKRRLRELARTREALIDHFVYDNAYRSTDLIWRKYFMAFTYATSLRRLKSV